MTPPPLLTVTLNGEPVPVNLVAPTPSLPEPEALTPVLESCACPVVAPPPEAPWQPGEVCRVSLTVSVRTTRHSV